MKFNSLSHDPQFKSFSCQLRRHTHRELAKIIYRMASYSTSLLISRWWMLISYKMLPVLVICCLNNPHVHTHRCKARMFCNACHLWILFIYLANNSRYFFAKNALHLSIHYCTVATWIPAWKKNKKRRRKNWNKSCYLASYKCHFKV